MKPGSDADASFGRKLCTNLMSGGIAGGMSLLGMSIFYIFKYFLMVEDYISNLKNCRLKSHSAVSKLLWN